MGWARAADSDRVVVPCPDLGGRRWRFGPLAFLVFVAVALPVDCVSPVEFRDPARPAILVPYLVLFFGSTLLMSAPMFRVDRRLWFVTALTTVALLASMGFAMLHGIG